MIYFANASCSRRFQLNWKSWGIRGHFLQLFNLRKFSFYFQNFQPVAYPKNNYGKFYTGDSYIVLNVSAPFLSSVKLLSFKLIKKQKCEARIANQSLQPVVDS